MLRLGFIQIALIRSSNHGSPIFSCIPRLQFTPLLIANSLFCPSRSSTASASEAAPCGTAVFCFAIAPECWRHSVLLRAEPRMQTLTCDSTPSLSVVPQRNLAKRKMKTKRLIYSATLVGFVGADPEQRQAKGNGSKFTVCSLATQRSWKNADDEWRSKVEWHRVGLVKPRLAEHVAAHITKPTRTSPVSAARMCVLVRPKNTFQIWAKRRAVDLSCTESITRSVPNRSSSGPEPVRELREACSRAY